MAYKTNPELNGKCIPCLLFPFLLEDTTCKINTSFEALNATKVTTRVGIQMKGFKCS